MWYATCADRERRRGHEHADSEEHAEEELELGGALRQRAEVAGVDKAEIRKRVGDMLDMVTWAKLLNATGRRVAIENCHWGECDRKSFGGDKTSCPRRQPDGSLWCPWNWFRTSYDICELHGRTCRASRYAWLRNLQTTRRFLAPPPADNERAAAACDAAAAVALAAARGVREDLARGFFAALNACWLACLARVVELLRRDAAALRAAAAPAAAAAAPVDDDDDLGEAVGRAADVDYSDSGSEDAGAAVPAFVDRTPAPPPPPAPAAPPLLPSPPETWTQKKRRKPTLPSHLRAKRRK